MPPSAVLTGVSELTLPLAHQDKSETKETTIQYPAVYAKQSPTPERLLPSTCCGMPKKRRLMY